MYFEDYFKNEKLYKSLADEINTNAKMLISFQSAIEQVSSVSKYRGLLGLTNDSLSSAGTSLSAFSDTQSGDIEDIGTVYLQENIKRCYNNIA